MGDGPDDENECAPLGTGVEIITFADEQEQLDNLDTTCAEDSYEPPSRVVVVGRGWVLALNFLSGLNEAEPIADVSMPGPSTSAVEGQRQVEGEPAAPAFV